MTSHTKQIWPYSIAFIILLLFYPYVFNVVLGVGTSAIILQLFFLILLLGIIIFKGIRFSYPYQLKVILAFQIVGTILAMIVHPAISYVLDYVNIGIVFALLVMLDSTIGVYNFFRTYNLWILIMALFGVVIFVLVQLGIGPAKEYLLGDGRPIYSWMIGLSNTYLPNISFVRYSGFFDEPGAMAYWGVAALVFNRLFFKNKTYEIILMICLVLTFSEGYYIQLAIFLLLSLFFNNSKKEKKRYITIIVAIVCAIVVFTNKSGNSDLYERSIGRLTNIESSGGSISLENTNRSKMMETARKAFLSEPLFGIGRLKREMGGEYMDDNPYETLAVEGVVGSIFLYLPILYLLFLSISRKDKDLFTCIIFISIGFLHRPFHNYLLYYFIFYSLVYMYLKKDTYEQAI